MRKCVKSYRTYAFYRIIDLPMEIHATIIEKLDYFYTSNKIPHIIFHGSSGSIKRANSFKSRKKVED